MRIAVITSFVAGEKINFFREVALVKSASLYADSIELLSLSSLVYTEWGAIAPDEAEALRRALITPDGTDSLPTFTTTNDRIAADSGVNELLPAVREELIRFKPAQEHQFTSICSLRHTVRIQPEQQLTDVAFVIHQRRDQHGFLWDHDMPFGGAEENGITDFDQSAPELSFDRT